MVSLINKLFANRNAPARALYAAVVAQARRPGFYTECGVPDTPNGRYEVIALHMFLVMQRLKGEPGLFELARTLSEVAVQDLDRSLREMGVGDLSVGRKVKSLAEGIYGRFGVYADGLSGDGDELAEALRRNLFSDSAPAPGAIEAISAYMQRNTASLAAQSSADLRDGRLSFDPPPGDGDQ